MIKKAFKWLPIILVAFWSLMPIYWTLRTSLLPHNEFMSIPLKYFPDSITFDNYRKLFGLGEEGTAVWEQFRKAMINSFISSAMTTIVVIIISVMAGYAFSRYKFKGKKFIFGIIVATLALPVYSVIIPLYRIVINLNLLDKQLGIVLIYTAAFVPLIVWLMKSVFDSIPLELEEAAMIDGASRFRVLLTILPLAVPGIIAAAIIVFLSSWSQFLLPLLFTNIKAKPLTVLITQFVSKTSIDYGMMTAAGIITILPPVVIVIFLNKYLVSGLMSGAVKE